ncbi:MAG: hypothetical protein V4594_05860 [Bacteroidota bacterium]
MVGASLDHPIDIPTMLAGCRDLAFAMETEEVLGSQRKLREENHFD